MSALSLPDAETLYAELVKKIRTDNDKRDKRFVLVGIHTGGAWLAERLYRDLNTPQSPESQGPAEQLGMLSVSFHRDDFDRIGLHALNKSSNIPFPIDGAHILLVDDVLQSGRTIRAAINELYDYGRPASISLAVLVDRGERELPIFAQYVGITLELPKVKSLVFNRDNQGRFYLSMEDKQGAAGGQDAPA
jgi:pyrimidine operon attenuation protein / uracil phosphoribosyltransferase